MTEQVARWVYGGTSGGRYVRGGTVARPADAAVVTRSGHVTPRGGLGGRGAGGGG